MAPKAHARTREKGIHVPAHPMVQGRAPSARTEERDLREMRLSLREQADDAADSGDIGESAEILLELGSSLISTQSFTAGLLVLDEALDAAREAAEPELVDRIVHALDRAMVAASA